MGFQFHEPTIAEKKEMSIDGILKEMQPNTYGPESPQWEKLRKALGKWSHENISTLLTLLTCIRRKAKFTMSKDECVAAGYYFGISNLGMTPVKVEIQADLHHPFNYTTFVHPSSMRKHYGINWPEWTKFYRNYVTSIVESDEEFEMYLDECKHFIDQLKAGDEYYTDAWRKVLQEE